MKIWYSGYQLYPKGALNAKVQVKFRRGAILRVRFEDESTGFADLCPFEEMGNRPLDFELKAIAVAKPTELGERALYYARLDAQARAKGIDVYDRTVKLKNHFLIPEIAHFELDRVTKLEAAGYSEFKVKMGRDLNLETELLEQLTRRLSAQSKLRLDFNCSLNKQRFIDWFEKAQKWLRPVLEFIEEPFPYDAKEWKVESQKRNIIFALDQSASPIDTKADGADVIVVKPVCQNVDEIVREFKGKNKKFVFTHNMDFPLGQMAALYSAQMAYHDLRDQMLSCGLQHHDIYEGFTFQDQIKSDGPYVLPPEENGFGFDKLLEAQRWIELK